MGVTNAKQGAETGDQLAGLLPVSSSGETLPAYRFQSQTGCPVSVIMISSAEPWTFVEGASRPVPRKASGPKALAARSRSLR